MTIALSAIMRAADGRSAADDEHSNISFKAGDPNKRMAERFGTIRNAPHER